MNDAPIYLDAHATTPTDPRVLESMLPCFREDFGNPASTQHAWGRRAADRVERARAQVAALLDCEPSEIVFTSGATESDNLAILGVAEWTLKHGLAKRRGACHVITAVTEHKAVLDACAVLEERGIEVTYLDVDADGRVDPAAVESALVESAPGDDTALVSLMAANNEIGVLHPLPEISAICRARGVLLHVDAAQALATEDCRVSRLGADLLSVSGHKIYGPKGVGALYVRRRRPRVRLEPQMHGGGHERGRRSGTLDVPSIVGLGTACELAAERCGDDRLRLAALRDRLLAGLRREFPDLVVHGSLDPDSRLPHNLNVALPGVDAAALMDEARGVAFASGSACTSNSFGSSADGSYVVMALVRARGGSVEEAEDAASRALRLGLLRTTTEHEIDRAVAEGWLKLARHVRGI